MLTRQEEAVLDRLIHFAVANNVSRIEEIILQLGERATLVVNTATSTGNTVLMNAAASGSVEAISVLLAVPGIEVNAANQSRNTALIYAAIYGRTEVVRKLLAFPGIEVDAENDAGRTASMLAAINGHIGVVAALSSFSDSDLPVLSITPPPSPIEVTVTSERQATSTEDLVVVQHRPVDTLTSTRPRAGLSFAERLAKIPGFSEGSIPKRFLDPISREIMTDPIVCVSGQTYERNSLVSYFNAQRNPRKVNCPMTRRDIFRTELNNETCVVIRECIEEFVLQQEAQYKQSLEQEKMITATASSAAAAASTAEVVNENNATDRVMPRAKKMCTARSTIFGNTTPVSNPASSTAVQSAEQDDEMVIDRQPQI